MKLKPLLFIAGTAAAVGAVLKRRGGGEQVSQAVSATAARVGDAAPQPVKDAAQQAGATVARAVESAPETVQRAVQKVAPGEPGGEGGGERYAPPAEALAQEPASPGGPPSDETAVKEAGRIASEPGEQLNVPEHDPPEGAVMPDTGSDPLVDSQTAAAAGDAGSIGGNVDEMAAGDESFTEDPAMRPVVEHAGDENEESFEAREGRERGHRETEP
jgi:hypothetical protein